ncbi:16S rRNA (guanine(966)-N(2))-methyltransferase RsmD [uncultured Microbacterium sp.]|uniref:16S rRNA (guanine(966)-N(2))-methyltransferase RsmD n=1 Tax=uncultured Microbacterium sp. TaxID=191216 RepID=UPI0025E15BCF|nr:16S rRNA (guanine(966)-N(2))-methyltransferase RsmD [uncultured Microbacterium sp.]
MTRIIAGAAGGTRLEVPGQGTRPTSDRVRESLFGALTSMGAIEGARVLDLYAGSGALALEALSRGARGAVLVERGRPAASIVRRNIAAVRKALGGALDATVQEGSVRSFLDRATGPFDLVFTDPPYDLSDAEMTADLVTLAPLLSADAVVVVERAKRSTPPDLPAAGLALIREKVYGDTALWWAEPAQASAPASR